MYGYVSLGQRDTTLAGEDEDGAAYLYPIYTGLEDAKRLPSGRRPRVTGSVVSRVFPTCFYMQKGDRSCGVRVNLPALVQMGDAVSAGGEIALVDGECTLNATNVQVVSSGNSIDPLGLNQRTLGGGAFGLQPAVVDDATPMPPVLAMGASNVGLLVQVTGTVTYSAADFFYLDDGSGVKDGSGNTGVKVVCPGLSVPAVHHKVTVIGISGAEQPTPSIVSRALRVNNQADITDHGI
jgi:hypothetical protein